MIPEYALRAALLADAGIAALVGTRIYQHDEVPQAKPAPAVNTPYITLQRISTRPGLLTLDRDEALGGPRIQFNCVAATGHAARLLATLVHGFFVGGYAEPGMNLARFDGRRDPGRDEETGLFLSQIDVLVTLAAAEAA
jgi:hypothetical protein